MNRVKLRATHTNTLLLIAIAVLALNQASYADGREEIVIGKRISVHSELLEKEMQLSVHIPDDYESSDERYPVLYTFQTHFEQVSGAVKNLYDGGMTPKLIVVNIDNYEFGYLTPTKIESNPNSGKADLFLQFFQEELFPHVDSKYRTQPYRIIFSNSWGAMFAAYAILAKPDVFDAAIASVLWVKYDGESRYMINNAENFLRSNEYDNYLYISMDNESAILPDLEAFVKILRRFPRKGLAWEYNYWPEEDHWSTPYRSIYTGLRSLFGEWNQVPLGVAFAGLEEIRKHEASLNQRFGYNIGISTSALRIAGQEHQRSGNHEEAISIFRYAIEKHPDDVSAYVTLGRAYEESNQIRSAREAYQKGYDLAVSSSHPQVKWVKNFLDRIDSKTNHTENERE